MPRTITANYYTHLQLTNPGDSPVSIAQGINITNGAGVAVFVFAGDWTIANAGVIQENAATNSIGLYLQKGASGVSRLVLTNQSSGRITGQFGVRFAGTGTVDNQGAIAGMGRDGVRIAYGGSVGNEAGASVAGAALGVLIYGGLGLVTNQSAISGASDDGVALIGGGAVANDAAGASIGGGAVGVYIGGGAGTVTTRAR